MQNQGSIHTQVNPSKCRHFHFRVKKEREERKAGKITELNQIRGLFPLFIKDEELISCYALYHPLHAGKHTKK